MTKKIIGIILMVLGVIYFLWTIYVFSESMKIKSQLSGLDLYLFEMLNSRMYSYLLINLLIAGGIAFGGYFLYNRSKKEAIFKFCKKCLNRKMNNQNLICSLTNEKATFRKECSNFIEGTVEENITSSTNNRLNQKNIVGIIGFLFGVVGGLVGILSYFSKNDDGIGTGLFITGVSFLLSLIGVFMRPRTIAIVGLISCILFFIIGVLLLVSGMSFKGVHPYLIR